MLKFFSFNILQMLAFYLVSNVDMGKNWYQFETFFFFIYFY